MDDASITVDDGSSTSASDFELFETTRMCWICCESGNEKGDDVAPLLATGCACRGSAGLAHTACLVTAATHNVNMWTTCPTCTQEFTGEADVLLARARWELVRERPAEDAERLFVANNLAVTLKESAGDNAGALALMQEVLAVRRRMLGNEHPSTLESITNLALQHNEMGNYTTALPLSEEACAATRRTLGMAHEHTLVSITSLAALHNSLGNYREALPLHEEALEAKRRVLGEGHLETMNSTHLLGQCMCGLGRRASGLQLLEQAAATARRVLGKSHPSTRHFEQGLRTAQEDVGMLPD